MAPFLPLSLRPRARSVARAVITTQKVTLRIESLKAPLTRQDVSANGLGADGASGGGKDTHKARFGYGEEETLKMVAAKPGKGD